MPTSAPVVCSRAGCVALTAPGSSSSYCPTCTAARARTPFPRWQRTPDRRPSASARGYTARWSAASRSFLAANPLCAAPACGRLSAHTDHIIPHRGNQQLFWDVSNWQPLCAACHGRKTRAGL